MAYLIATYTNIACNDKVIASTCVQQIRPEKRGHAPAAGPSKCRAASVFAVSAGAKLNKVKASIVLLTSSCARLARPEYAYMQIEAQAYLASRSNLSKIKTGVKVPRIFALVGSACSAV